MANMHDCPGRLTPEMAIAAVQEIRLWLELLEFHGRFMRNTLNTEEEALFRFLDSLTQNVSALRARIAGQDDVALAGCARELIADADAVARPLRQAKAEMAEAVSQCRVISSLPPTLYDHVRRETDVFLGIINGLVGGPVPSRMDIGVPEPPTALDPRAGLSPRALIPGLSASSPSCASDVLWDEILFFTRVNAEHGEVMAMFFRPGVQDDLANAARQASATIMPILQQLEAARQQGLPISQVTDLMQENIAATMAWVSFLQQLHTSIITCQVPTGQVNFPAHLAAHMELEGDYSLQLMQMAASM